MKPKKFNRQDIKSLAVIAFSLILMTSALYTGFVKGRADESGNTLQTDIPSYGLEDLISDIPQTSGHSAEPVTPAAENRTEAIKNTSPAKQETETAKVEDSSAKADKSPSKNTSSASIQTVKISLRLPVKSNTVVMDYSYNTDPVYSKTFNEYRSDHEGIDYAADKGEDVHPAADGTVEKIYEDEKLGYTVIIDHGFYKTHYSNLDKNITVSAGDKVTTDTVIGKVGSSATFESMEDSHLHFAVYTDGECIDPKPYIR